ncbi:ATP synthase F1 subunit epsilon [Candidatus Saccharibacteria bacterium]|nr:MAG: ATP synthase F1 subunit epsilon [Candidatus Saccharibacteria bacterium]
MKLELITLSGPKIDSDVYEVILPTVDGEIGVFPGHERLVTLADNGIISIRRKKTDRNDDMEHFATYGGVVEVAPDHIRILVDEADTADEILEEEATRALKAARSMKATAKDSVELAKAQQLIDRHAVRLKVAGLRRRHRG